MYKHICAEPYRKGPYVGKINIKFRIAYSRGHSDRRFDTKIRCLAQFMADLLRIGYFFYKIISAIRGYVNLWDP